MGTIRVGILTISDRSSRGERPDTSGPAIKQVVEDLGWQSKKYEIIPDDFHQIRATLSSWSDSGELDVILTTGGTGFSPRDITPEATRSVIDRDAPGMAEAMRARSLEITPHAMLSRGVCGIRGSTIIINLPGSKKAALENLQVIIPVIPHAVELLMNASNAEAGHILNNSQR